MSVLSLEADIRQHEWQVRYVPKSDFGVFSCPLLKIADVFTRFHGVEVPLKL